MLKTSVAEKPTDRYKVLTPFPHDWWDFFFCCYIYLINLLSGLDCVDHLVYKFLCMSCYNRKDNVLNSTMLCYKSIYMMGCILIIQLIEVNKVQVLHSCYSFTLPQCFRKASSLKVPARSCLKPLLIKKIEPFWRQPFIFSSSCVQCYSSRTTHLAESITLCEGAKEHNGQDEYYSFGLVIDGEILNSDYQDIIITMSKLIMGLKL